MLLYQILVLTQTNEGKPIRTRFHRVWDQKVRDISKGLTILKPATGQWICQEGKLYLERMIPVNIACTEEQIKQIAEMTGKYYSQLTVMFYKISDEVFFMEFDPAKKFKRKQ